jgi:hypothetical protein
VKDVTLKDNIIKKELSFPLILKNLVRFATASGILQLVSCKSVL